MDGHDLALSRAEWEMNRRVGRSQALTVVCDSWRDKGGTLWQPNAFAPLYLPQLKLAPDKPWIIGQVTFVRDGHQGTIAELMLMPKEAFSVEPSTLQPNDWQVGDALRGGAARQDASGGTLV